MGNEAGTLLTKIADSFNGGPSFGLPLANGDEDD